MTESSRASTDQKFITESGLRFGPFNNDHLFELEIHSNSKGVYAPNNTPKMAEFAWLDESPKRQKVWVVEAKSSVARVENIADFNANLDQWSLKLLNALALIAGVKAGTYKLNADLSEVPPFVTLKHMRDLDFRLVVVITAAWVTSEDCALYQNCLANKLTDFIRAWGLNRDAIFVFNRQLAQQKRLAILDDQS